MSHDINALSTAEQARHHIRVAAGYDDATNKYYLMDMDSDGKIGSRQYVYDPISLSWIAAGASGAGPAYDEIVLSYTGDNLTSVVYKLDSVTVSTLTLSYTGSNLTGVVRT